MASMREGNLLLYFLKEHCPDLMRHYFKGDGEPAQKEDWVTGGHSTILNYGMVAEGGSGAVYRVFSSPSGPLIWV